MSISDGYTHEVTVKRLSHSRDDYGGQSSTYSTHLSSYNCRIYRATGESDVENIGKHEGTDFKAMGNEADIKDEDKFVDGTDEYKVKRAVKIYDKSLVHHMEFLIDKIR